jgi:hypothetical protein
MFLYKKIQTSLKLTTQKCSKPTLNCLASLHVRIPLLNFTKILSIIIQTQQMTNMWHFHHSLISHTLQRAQHAYAQINMWITIVSTQENAQLLTTKLPSYWKLPIKICLNNFPWLIQFLNIKSYKATKLCKGNCLSRYRQQYCTQKITDKSIHQKPLSSYQQVSIHKFQHCSKSFIFSWNVIFLKHLHPLQ